MIRRPREKTFIVYECGASQVLSGENREVRSGFEVSDKNGPPLLPLDFGIVPRRQTVCTFVRKRRGREKSAGHSTTLAGHGVCEFRVVIKMYRTFLCLSAKDIFQKNVRGEPWPRPFSPPPRWVRDPTVGEGGPFARPPINNRQKQVYSHRQVAAVS